MNKLFYVSTGLLFVLMASCQTKNASEAQIFEASVRKELPFHVDSMRLVNAADMVTFHFSAPRYITTSPDAEVRSDGALHVYRTFFHEPHTRQTEDKIWRNIVVSKKNRRVICVDRYLKEGKTHGFVYVLQSESEKYPTFGTYHWDVSDSHNIESVGGVLDAIRDIAVKRLKGDGVSNCAVPTSQYDYWALMFHADSLFADGLYAEAKQVYDLAFTEDRYILPSQLSTVAYKMKTAGNDQAALQYLNHRVQMEKDYYMEPSGSPYPQLTDTFEMRKQTWHYDLVLKEKLEWLFERDQHDRMLWDLSASSHPEQTQRNNLLRERAWDTDSTNLIMVNEILSEGGFPRKSQVGEFAVLAVWSVFQHNSLEYQKQFLPQLEQAVRNGDIAPMYLAALKDRIDIREGRPQKYGTQKNCPLLDASRVNEWRQEVGLPPIEP